MAQILVGEGKGTLACANCGTSQTHRVFLYYDDDTEQLYIEKKCVCEDSSGRYVEEFAVDVSAQE